MRKRRKKSLFDSLRDRHKKEVSRHREKKKKLKKKKSIPFFKREKEHIFALTNLGQQEADNSGSESSRNTVLISLSEHGPQTASSIARREGIPHKRVSNILWGESRPDRKFVRVVNDRNEDYE